METRQQQELEALLSELNSIKKNKEYFPFQIDKVINRAVLARLTVQAGQPICHKAMYKRNIPGVCETPLEHCRVEGEYFVKLCMEIFIPFKMMFVELYITNFPNLKKVYKQLHNSNICFLSDVATLKSETQKKLEELRSEKNGGPSSESTKE